MLWVRENLRESVLIVSENETEQEQGRRVSINNDVLERGGQGVKRAERTGDKNRISGACCAIFLLINQIRTPRYPRESYF